MKGIVLAGGTGSRLWPITRSVSKQLLPIYDKPMIFYPISTLMLAGIREILIITTPHDQPLFKALLGNGSELGVTFEYATQSEPKGLAQAISIGEKFLGNESFALILGDNIFHGVGLGHDLHKYTNMAGCHIFLYTVFNPTNYGILEVDNEASPISIVEKPPAPKSNLAVTGLYFFDERAIAFAKQVKPSTRGELEITSVIQFYLESKELNYTVLSRGSAWLDTGQYNSLNDAGNFVRVIEERTGLKIGCLEEIAWRNGWISDTQLVDLANSYSASGYGNYLLNLKNDSATKL
jgi:glucose-1-phosphate thymidylyltransferase